MSTKVYNEDHLIVFLFVIFFFKTIYHFTYPLINDEAYTLTISKYFSLSYFDHPPLMMVHIFFTIVVVSVSHSFFTTWFIYWFLYTKIAAIIYSRLLLLPLSYVFSFLFFWVDFLLYRCSLKLFHA